MVVEIFGIKACDTMKKARAFLEARGIDYVFHDYKVEGVTAGRLSAWAAAVGWETLLNTSGTTFRKLSEADRQDLTEAKAIALMIAHPSLIKRPVLTRGAEILVGFKPEAYSRFIG
ncbi:ArsC family reductase [Prosthecomicrobium hirschii]|uniref:ArsC family reductase n=1 Tax=Prosthecodimorpha hirschii TaxID=665126 RepID=UPI00221E9140|nr:ArsC family reductase [Prosthecomicrobium hirschii]MCW1839400.1 ArsC family reductase [Prosthecomicrobium hirschii]